MRIHVRNSVTEEPLGDWELPWVPRIGECLKIEKAIGADEYIIERIQHELNGSGYHIFLEVRPVS